MRGIYDLIRTSADGGDVLVVDCLSRVQPYGLRALGSIRPYLDRVHIARAFTAYQLRAIAEGLDGWTAAHRPSTVIIVGAEAILTDVPGPERPFVRGRVLKHAKRLARTPGVRAILVEARAASGPLDRPGSRRAARPAPGAAPAAAGGEGGGLLPYAEGGVSDAPETAPGEPDAAGRAAPPEGVV